MESKACVSSSSVKKTLLTPCILMSVPFDEVMGAASNWISLAQSNAVKGIPGGHVGEDYFVSDFQARKNFDRVDGAFAELTLTRRPSEPSSTSLNKPMVLSDWPRTGRPT